MSRSAPAFAVLAAAALAATPLRAAAEPVPEGSRIAVQAGWRYAPNARFGELAANSGHPMSGESFGGPGVLAVFAYRPSAQIEVAIDVGYSRETFGFLDGSTLSLDHLPISVATRWSPWTGDFTPYLGGGVGYFLNFFAGGPVGGLESHTAGPFFLAGATWEVTERVALVAEYRLAFARVQVPGLGAVQTGGNWLSFGAQYSFPPERRELR